MKSSASQQTNGAPPTQQQQQQQQQQQASSDSGGDDSSKENKEVNSGGEDSHQHPKRKGRISEYLWQILNKTSTHFKLDQIIHAGVVFEQLHKILFVHCSLQAEVGAIRHRNQKKK